jgi:hypothetical protein
VTLLAMPPAWVDFSWAMVRGERDDVKQISVIVLCTAELCQRQGDEHVNGGSADDLVANLRGRQLPFPVEESGCLGACGMGTMVAIDHHDGNANLVAGLDLTLTELGVCGVVQESITTNDEVLSCRLLQTARCNQHRWQQSAWRLQFSSRMLQFFSRMLRHNNSKLPS